MLFYSQGMALEDSLKFLLAIFVVVYIPGQALIWLLDLKVGRLARFHLALICGITTSTVVYKLAWILHLQVLFWIWLGVAVGLFSWRLFKHPPKRKDFHFRLTYPGIAFFVIVLLVLGVLLVDNYRNGVPQADGSVRINMHYYDGFIRNAVVREVSHSVPPQMPFASGFPLSYHYGMDLFISIFYRYFHLQVLDLIHRFALTVFFLLFVGAVFLFIQELTASVKTALLGAFLAVFSSGGFAYMATYFLGIHQWGNLFFSFYLFHFIGINSILPAAAILITAFLGIHYFLKTQKIAWLWVTAILLGFVLEFKMFLFGPVVGALLLSGGLMVLFRKDYSLWKVLGGMLVFAAPLVIFALLSNAGGPEFAFRFKFVDWIRFSLQDLNWTTLQRAWGDLIHRSIFYWKSILAVFPAVFIFFVGSFGLSLLAVPSMMKEFFSFRKVSPLRMFLVVLFAGCVIYYFGVDVSLGGRPRNVTNIYVYFIGLIILCMFWAEKVLQFCQKRKKSLQIVILTLVILLSIPNSVRLLWLKTQTPQPRIYPASFLQLSDWARSQTDPETTFVHPLRLHHACYFMDRRVVLDNSAHSFLTWHLTAEQIEARQNDIRRFFEDPRLGADVLDKYRIDYVMVFNEDGYLGNLPDPRPRFSVYVDLGTKLIRKVKRSHELEKVYENRDYVVFRVHPLAEDKRTVFVLTIQDGQYLFEKFDK